MMSAWIQTYGGKKCFPTALKESDVNINIIAHSLAHQCRFGGHCSRYYSVGEHCVRASKLVRPQDAMWALLHDATEAFMVDIPKPIKLMPEFEAYRALEKINMEVICRVFSLPLVMPESVHMADEVMLATEARDLMQPIHPEWQEWLMYEPTTTPIGVTWTPVQARHMFLERYKELRDQRCLGIEDILKMSDD